MELKNELALFAGAGGGILGTKLLGFRCICAVERDQYARSVLLQRQNDGMLPAFPIWDDVTTFDGRNWLGRIDLVSGGFPCQDIAAAGSGKGRVGLALGGRRVGVVHRSGAHLSRLSSNFARAPLVSQAEAQP